ncbi:MAG: lipoprotein-releasing ABC transporter permease subunit [Elusimicrobiota bacterium]
MNWELFISKRYLAGKRRQVFTLFTTIIAIAGVIVGVAALVVTFAIMTGFQEEIRDRILGTQAHITVMTFSREGIVESTFTVTQILAVKDVAACAPFIVSQGLIRYRGNNQGVMINGIRPKDGLKVTDLTKRLVAGTWSSLDSKNENVILGSELAKNLGIYPDDEIILMSFNDTQNMAMMTIPKMRKYKVTGLFESGMYEFDNTFVFMNLQTAQEFLGLGKQISGYQVKVNNFYGADLTAKKIQSEVKGFYIARSWMKMNKNLFSALKIEKLAMTIVLVLIILVAAFNVLSTLMMTTMEKTKDIAVLTALGAEPRNVMRIFVFQGAMIGVVGTIAGILTGVGVSMLLKYTNFISLPADVYYITRIPVRIVWQDLLLIGMVSIIISILSTLYPAGKAAKIDPAKALRTE